jgi:hypothetical protein
MPKVTFEGELVVMAAAQVLSGRVIVTDVEL